MLASVRDFLRPWQFAPVAVFVVGWLWGGGWLLLRALKKRDYPQRIKLGNCVVISLVAGVAGAITGLVFFYLFGAIGSIAGAELRIPGAVAGGVAMVVVAFLSIYAMLQLTVRQAVRMATAPLAVIGIFGAIIALPAGIYSVKAKRAQDRKDQCRSRIAYIASALETCQRSTGSPAASLEELVGQNYIEAGDLICPGAPERDVGYFYEPARIVPRDNESEQIILCDLRDNHGSGRNVVLANRQVMWYENEKFATLLEIDPNKDFATALRQRDGP